MAIKPALDTPALTVSDLDNGGPQHSQIVAYALGEALSRRGRSSAQLPPSAASAHRRSSSIVAGVPFC